MANRAPPLADPATETTAASLSLPSLLAAAQHAGPPKEKPTRTTLRLSPYFCLTYNAHDTISSTAADRASTRFNLFPGHFLPPAHLLHVIWMHTAPGRLRPRVRNFSLESTE